jgi:hypothetical protein
MLVSGGEHRNDASIFLGLWQTRERGQKKKESCEGKQTKALSSLTGSRRVKKGKESH